MAAQLTLARRRALAVLLCAWDAESNLHSVARVSNETTPADRLRGGSVPAVYWQTARWLLAEGLAERTSYLGPIRLTEAGVELARSVS